MELQVNRREYFLMFFAIFLFIYSPQKATIDKQSPHAKLLFNWGVLFSKRALLVFFLMSSKSYVIPLGVSQLHDLEIPERWHHFHIQLRLLFLCV